MATLADRQKSHHALLQDIAVKELDLDTSGPPGLIDLVVLVFLDTTITPDNALSLHIASTTTTTVKNGHDFLLKFDDSAEFEAFFEGTLAERNSMRPQGQEMIITLVIAPILDAAVVVTGIWL